MSPLGTLVLPSSRRDSLLDSHSHNNVNDHPLLRLMSVSLVNERPRGASLMQSLALTLNGTSGHSHSQSQAGKMTLKEPDSTGSPRAPDRDPDLKPAEDDDEVLSIGRDDDQSMIIDCDENESSEAGSTRLTFDQDSLRSSTSPSLQSPSLSTAGSYSHRARNYSSEDSVKSFPLSLTEAFLNNHLSPGRHMSMTPSATQQALHHHHQASLFFSIANILRPDFGLGKVSPTTSAPPTAKRPTKGSARPESSSKKSGRRPEPVIPIDLSRPVPNGNGSPTGSTVPPAMQRNKAGPGQGNKSRPESAGPKVTGTSADEKGGKETLWPAWVYCTRYSDRPSSGPRSRRGRKQKEKEIDEKRPRTAFTAEQLSRLKKEFDENRYLTEKRRQDLAKDLRLHENQIKIWFQNKRAKLKKASGTRGGLALQLMAQGLYNHSTIPPRGCGDEDDEDSD